MSKENRTAIHIDRYKREDIYEDLNGILGDEMYDRVQQYFEILESIINAEWKCRLNQLADECTTDFGVTDLEMFAEKVLKLTGDGE